jgi:hypothetical protein
VRVFIEIILLAALITLGIAYGPVLWRRWRQRRRAPRAEPLPPVAPEALRLARQDERIGEAVELRARIAELVGRREVGLDRVLVLEVDELLAAMVGLQELRGQLRSHLASISEERIARDAALLDAATVSEQRRQIEALRQRDRTLEAELARATAGLRETWLGLLEAIAQPGSGAVAHDRIRAQIEGLRIRIQAEREVRAEAVENA